MFTWLRCWFSILRQSLGEVLGWRRNLFFAFAGLLVAGVTVFVLERAGDRRDNNSLFGIVFAIAWLQLLIPITAIYFSAALLREEISGRTIVYLLSGPVPRSSIWLAKFTASVIVTWIVVLGSLLVAGGLVLFVIPVEARFGQHLADSTVQGCLLVALVAPLAYAAIGTVLAIRFRWAILWGAGFFVVWESFVGSVPAQSGLRSLTIVDSLRTLLYYHTPAADELHEVLFNWATVGGEFKKSLPSAEDALLTLLYFTAIPLALTLWIGHRRDFESGAKDE